MMHPRDAHCFMFYSKLVEIDDDIVKHAIINLQ